MSAPPKIARVLLVHHGQIHGNQKRCVGWADPPLNELGRRQALLIAQRLAGEGLTAIFSSPLTRALQTASPLAKGVGLDIVSDPDLLEIHYGECQGRAKDEMELMLRKHHLNDRLPGGESLDDIYTRANRFLLTLLNHLTPGSVVAVFAHYWIARMVFGVLAGRDLEALFTSGSYKPANGTIYEICLDLDAPRESSIVSQVYLTLEGPAARLPPPGLLQ